MKPVDVDQHLTEALGHARKAKIIRPGRSTLEEVIEQFSLWAPTGRARIAQGNHKNNLVDTPVMELRDPQGRVRWLRKAVWKRLCSLARELAPEEEEEA